MGSVFFPLKDVCGARLKLITSNPKVRLWISRENALDKFLFLRTPNTGQVHKRPKISAFVCDVIECAFVTSWISWHEVTLIVWAWDPAIKACFMLKTSHRNKIGFRNFSGFSNFIGRHVVCHSPKCICHCLHHFKE